MPQRRHGSTPTPTSSTPGSADTGSRPIKIDLFRGEWSVAKDQVSGLLGHHHHRRVDVAVGDVTHRRRVDDSNTFDAALWWPEWAFQFPLIGRFEIHNDIDLHLVDPDGAVRASSISIPSVFERARVSGRVAQGTWRLRIRGYNVPGGIQTVYWAAHVRL